jgi:hypothetical protein
LGTQFRHLAKLRYCFYLGYFFLDNLPHSQNLYKIGFGRGELEAILQVPLPQGEGFRVRGMAVVGKPKLVLIR